MSVVLARDVPKLWARVWPLLHPSIVRDTLDEVTVRRYLAQERWQLWVCELGGEVVVALTTSVYEAVSGDQVVIQLCGGSLGSGPHRIEQARAILEQIEDWARSIGARRLEFEGRTGWGRLFPDYRVRALVYTKELSL